MTFNILTEHQSVTSERFPQFIEINELPPYVRGDHVTEVLPSGATRRGTVIACFWDDDMGAHGEWTLYLAYYIRDAQGKQTDVIGYTWTNLKGIGA